MRTGGLESAPHLELGRSFRDGDETALAALYDRHLPGIYDFLARLVRDPPAAEDLTQIHFVRAWEARLKLRDPARVRAWLYTIANNLALNHLTRRPPTDPIDEQFDLATPAPGPARRAVPLRPPRHGAGGRGEGDGGGGAVRGGGGEPGAEAVRGAGF